MMDRGFHAFPAVRHQTRHHFLSALYNQARAKELANKYDLEVYTGLDDMLADDIVDVVSVAMLNHLHCDTVIAAAQAGINNRQVVIAVGSVRNSLEIVLAIYQSASYGKVVDMSIEDDETIFE